jgi:hypothetical protein
MLHDAGDQYVLGIRQRIGVGSAWASKSEMPVFLPSAETASESHSETLRLIAGDAPYRLSWTHWRDPICFMGPYPLALREMLLYHDLGNRG